METNKTKTSRRAFVNKFFKGVALGIAGSTLLPQKAMASNKTSTKNFANLFAMWVHGHQGTLEGEFHNGKDSVGFISKMREKMIKFHSAGYARALTGRTIPGETISLPGEAAATKMPASGGALFTIWDSGTKSNPKNGEFWVHYAVPTPVIANNIRTKAAKILVKAASTDANFYVSEVELWDANKRIFNATTKLWGPDKMHGFNLKTPVSVQFGLCISLKIKGERVSADRILEISGVGVDLMA